MIRRILLFVSMVLAGTVGSALLRAERKAQPADVPGRRRTGRRPAAESGDEVGAAPRTGDATGASRAEPERCAAVTTSGSRCSRQPEPGSSYCWQHGDG